MRQHEPKLIILLLLLLRLRLEQCPGSSVTHTQHVSTLRIAAYRVLLLAATPAQAAAAGAC
jgi:hypothetical protein